MAAETTCPECDGTGSVETGVAYDDAFVAAMATAGHDEVLRSLYRANHLIAEARAECDEAIAERNAAWKLMNGWAGKADEEQALRLAAEAERDRLREALKEIHLAAVRREYDRISGMAANAINLYGAHLREALREVSPVPDSETPTN